jgi:hypothetical protein
LTADYIAVAALKTRVRSNSLLAQVETSFADAWLHSEETIHEIVVPSHVDIRLWRHADFDDLSPHLAVDITDMTADGRPSSFDFGIGAAPYSQ